MFRLLTNLLLAGVISAKEEKVQTPSKEQQAHYLKQTKDAWEHQAAKERSEAPGGAVNRYFSYGSTLIPHKSKAHRGGEDAFVASDNFLAVADGVGGWVSNGIDSGQFSKRLVWDMKRLHGEDNGEELKNILVEAVKAHTRLGTSTAVLVKFDTQRHNFIKATNLGDSGYVIFRPTEKDGKFGLEKIFRTVSQQYSFNFPYQCGSDPKLPYTADDFEHEIQDNDIIILASDGVFDNLYDEDVEECIMKFYKEAPAMSEADLQSTSNCVANNAHDLGYKQDYLSPFAKDARDQGVNYPAKGKDDDIVAVAAQIHTESEGRPRQEQQDNAIPNLPEHDSWEHYEL